MPALLISFPVLTVNPFPLSRWVGRSAYVLRFRDHPLPQGLSVSHASPAIHRSRLRVHQHTRNMPGHGNTPVVIHKGSGLYSIFWLRDGKIHLKKKRGKQKKLSLLQRIISIPASGLILSLPKHNLNLTNKLHSALKHTRFMLPTYMPQLRIKKKVRQRGSSLTDALKGVSE